MTEKVHLISADRSLPKSSFVTEEQVRLLYMQAPISNSVVITLSLLYYFILQPRLNSDFLLLWLIMLLATASYRLYLWYNQKSRPETRSAASWLNHYLIGCGLVGCSWSLIYPKLYGTNDPFVLAALLMLAFGVMSSAVPILSVSIPAFIAYVFPQGLMLIFTLLHFEDTTYFWLASAVGAYLIMTTLFTRNTNRSILQSIKLQAQNNTLIEDLNNEISQREMLISQRTVEVKKKNHDLIIEITERKLAEKELRENEERLRLALTAANQGLYDLNTQTGETKTNPEYAMMLGYNPATFCETNQKWLERLHPDDLEPVSNLYKAYANGETPEYNIEFRQRMKSGGWKWILSIGRIIERDEKGKPLRMLGTHTDISERRREEEEKGKLQAQLLQAQKMEALGTLTGGIAHDFNNILAAILGYAELIEKDVSADSQVGQDIKEIIVSGRRAADLVKHLLVYSRKTGMEKQHISPHFIIKEALKMLRATLPTSITIEAAVDPNCGCVFMNPTNLHQVIINLCTNASQSLPDRKGTICINLQRQEFSSRDLPPDQNISAGGFVVITVSDTGCGMDKTTENRIFEPYFTTKEKGTGTGLGLAVVHGIVEDCNGFIKIETTVGIGSSFHVYLPASESPAEELPSADEKDIFPSVSKNIRILVVDDDPLLVKISERSLTNNGYYVTSFTDSRKALEAFQNMPDNFDMIITDQTMPGLTGADLAKEVLKVKSSMPIIMCTGHSETVSEENALSLGVKKYVLKPIKGEELLNAVRELLGGE